MPTYWVRYEKTQQNKPKYCCSADGASNFAEDRAGKAEIPYAKGRTGVGGNRERELSLIHI